MSKIVSQLELTEIIDKDLAWRRKELKVLKDNIPPKDSPLQKVILRASIPILYAHWEGFAKKSCEYYLEYVSNRKPIHKELKPQFISLALNKELKKVELKNIEDKTKAITFLIECLDKEADIPTENIIQTKSNLRFPVFKEIIYILGLNFKEFEEYESLINDLVDTRNTIAHGNSHKVIYPTYLQMHSDMDILMETLRTEIQNSAVLAKYKI